MKVLLAILPCLVSVALAQAPAAATDLDATLLFDLLGSVNAITVDVPEEVQEILVVGMHGGVIQVAQEVSTSGAESGGRAEVTAGGVTAVGRCDSMAFVRIAFIAGGGGNLGSRCFDGEERLAFAKLHTGLPLFFVGAMTELPFDTWLAFESMRIGSGPIATPAEAFVFYIYLNTSHDRTQVGAPDFDSWSAAARAFDLGTDRSRP